ncbi:MAG: flap endonuclease, partial [Anaerolineales bacterium]|nr:flap endonuclease [Anaerolineales bacterium]
LASAVRRFRRNKSVEQIVLCSPDKDLAQLVSGSRIVCWDRRRDVVIDEAGVVAKYGVRPSSIPDWLALVGDAADGYPGLPGWGAKSTSVVLARYEHLEAIPAGAARWRLPAIPAGRAASLAASLVERREEALLYRTLATLRQDVAIRDRLSDLRWRGADRRLEGMCQALGDSRFAARISLWR